MKRENRILACFVANVLIGLGIAAYWYVHAVMTGK